MRVPSRLRASAGALTRSKLRRHGRRFLQATVDCRTTQHEVLSRILRINAGSRFSHEYGLSASSTLSNVRSSLPISDYEFYRPYVDAMRRGDHAALLGEQNRLLMFSLSSGTTADSKFIPITEQFLRDYRRGWQVWGIFAYDDHPAANGKKIVQFCSDFERFCTPTGTPCGNISGLAAATQSQFVRLMYSLPYIVSKISDPRGKYYASLRTALIDDSIGMVTTANPSTLLHIARFADEHREALIRDMADGTLSYTFDIDEPVRKALRRRIGIRRPGRARQLERIVEKTGHLYPKDFWPDIDIVAVWTSGSCGAYLNSLPEYYGDASIRDHGLSASEGRMTIPRSDFSTDGVLDITSHHFEFIPEAEYGNPSPNVLEAHELQQGQNYYILLTTASGFYRYDICDVVQCTGFCNTAPTLRFLHKGAHISSITGEKISESQIVDAVQAAVRRMEIQLEYFTVIPSWGEPPGYQLMIEERDLPSLTARAGLASRVDDGLQQLNCEYREKRVTGRLAPMKDLPLPAGTWKRFAEQRISRLGGSIEQYKHPCLIPDIDYGSEFLREFGNGGTYAHTQSNSPLTDSLR